MNRVSKDKIIHNGCKIDFDLTVLPNLNDISANFTEIPPKLYVTAVYLYEFAEEQQKV